MPPTPPPPNSQAGNAEDYIKRGNACMKLNQYKQAIANYNQAIELNPQYTNAYDNRGYAYAALNQNERAIADYNQAIELNPQFANAYYNRGHIYQALKQFGRALANYNQAATLFQQQNNPQGYQFVQQQLERLSEMEAQ